MMLAIFRCLLAVFIDRAQPRTRCSQARLSVERLGEIIAPATLTWDAPMNGAEWSEATSWRDETGANKEPEAGDELRFTAAKTANSVNDVSLAFKSLTIDAGYTGVISMAKDLRVNSAFAMAGGTITSLSRKTITIQNTASGSSSMTWTGGSIKNIVLQLGSLANRSTTTTVSGAGDKHLYGTEVQNEGTFNLQGGGNIILHRLDGNNAQLLNKSGAVFDIRSLAGISEDVAQRDHLTQEGTGFSQLGLVTYGTFKKSAGAESLISTSAKIDGGTLTVSQNCILTFLGHDLYQADGRTILSDGKLKVEKNFYLWSSGVLEGSGTLNIIEEGKIAQIDGTIKPSSDRP